MAGCAADPSDVHPCTPDNWRACVLRAERHAETTGHPTSAIVFFENPIGRVVPAAPHLRVVEGGR